MALTELGKTTQSVLSAIVEYKRAHDGCAPTLRELRVTTGISSTSVIAHHLTRLEEAGLIERDAGNARLIRVVGGEWRRN